MANLQDHFLLRKIWYIYNTCNEGNFRWVEYIVALITALIENYINKNNSLSVKTWTQCSQLASVDIECIIKPE